MIKWYRKLVRDNVPKMLGERGIIARYTDLDSAEYLQALNRKLLAELKEYYDTNTVEELVDIVEVIYAILRVKGIEVNTFHKMRKDKKDAKGGFDKRIFLSFTQDNTFEKPSVRLTISM